MPAVAVPDVQGPHQFVSPSGGGVGETTLNAVFTLLVVTVFPPVALNVPVKFAAAALLVSTSTGNCRNGTVPSNCATGSVPVRLLAELAKIAYGATVRSCRGESFTKAPPPLVRTAVSSQ